MITEEMEYIENLINSLFIDCKFDESNSNVINSLFNRLSINIILSNIDRMPSFKLDRFLKTGVVPGMYDDKIEGINTFYSKKENSEYIYKEILRALKDNKYIFDSKSNIVLGTDNLNTTMSSLHLYRLANSLKKSKKDEVFFFSKKPLHTFKDSKELEEYLREVKSFIVRFYNPDKRYHKYYVNCCEKTNLLMKLENNVKVDNLIKVLSNELGDYYDYDVIKNKISIPSIIKSSMNKDINFYKLPVYEQKKYISKWILDLENVNNINDSMTQIYLLLSEKERKSIPEDAKMTIFTSLSNLFLLILKDYDIDFDSISMSEFKIKEYVSMERQKALLKISDVINKINNEIVDSNMLNKLKDERNSLQNMILYKKDSDVNDLVFSNNKIYELLCNCIRNGQVYNDFLDKKRIVYKLKNKDLGKDIFVASINYERLLDFIKSSSTVISDYVDFKY